MAFLGELTTREVWTLIHGMVLGALFLLAFAGGLAGLWSLRERLLTAEGVREPTPRLWLGTTVMAIVAWLTVLTGTFVIYPWYRAAPPEGATDLTAYPRYQLLANEATAACTSSAWNGRSTWPGWRRSWRAVAFCVAYYGIQLIRRNDIRRALIILFTLAFLAAGAAGLYGALITKAAPVA